MKLCIFDCSSVLIKTGKINHFWSRDLTDLISYTILNKAVI